MSSKQPDFSHIMQVGMGFWPAKVLLSAVELGVFTELGGVSKSGEELGKALGLHPRGIKDVFATLVALGLLQKAGRGSGAKSSNTEATAHYLETLYSEPSRLEEFMNAMQGLSLIHFRSFAEKFDFSPYQTLCDVGGANGCLSITIAEQHPHMRCTSFDLPVVEPIAKKAIESSGLQERVATAAGDFFKDPLPNADILTMGMILHDWNLDNKKMLIGKAYEALPEGGAFVVIENIIDDDRKENAFGLMMSLNMLIEFGDAFDFTGADFTSWCKEVGFKTTNIIPLGGPASAAVAFK